MDFKGEVAWKALKKEGFTCASGFDPLMVGNESLNLFKKAVHRVHGEVKKKGNSYPEVEITEIWEEVVKGLVEKTMIVEPDERVDYGDIAFLFECLTNPVYPMPSMKEVLHTIETLMPMGIVSNAQFFTPILMNYFLGVTDCMQNKEIDGFVPHFSSYSYRHRTAKPGTSLFEEILPALQQAGYLNHEVLFVGNDMLNDIVPASKLGFKTVLFAGDRRSLRLRQNDPRVDGVTADRTITHLEQLLTIIGAA